MNQLIQLGYVVLRVKLSDLLSKPWSSFIPFLPVGDSFAHYESVSTTSDYVHYIIGPLYADGISRVVSSDVGRLVGYMDPKTEVCSYKINAASNSYTGFIALDSHSRSLLRRTLDSCLPVSSYDDASNGELLEKLATEWKDFYGDCWGVMTSTGYTGVLCAMGGMLSTSGATLWVMDDNDHNSMIVGARLSGKADIVKFKHNDFEDLEKQIENVEMGKYERVIVALESLYSMEGSQPDFQKLATLKAKFGFLVFCDEAHASMTTQLHGRTRKVDSGAGSAHGHEINVVDVRIASHSKAVGSIGCYVGTTRPELVAGLEARVSVMKAGDMEPIPLPSIIHTLYTLRCRQLLPELNARLQEMSNFIQESLKKAGFIIQGHGGSPVMIVHIGDIVKAARMCGLCFERGLAILPVAPPAAPAPGLRLQVTTTMTTEDVNSLLRILVLCAMDIGVLPSTTVLSLIPRFHPKYQEKMLGNSGDSSVRIRESAFNSTLQDIKDTEESWRSSGGSKGAYAYDASQVRAAGISGLERYGFGLSSARWLNGTTKAHLDLEQYLQNLLAGSMHAMLFNDTRNAHLGIAHALKRKPRGSLKHFLLYEKRNAAIQEGLSSAAREDGIIIDPRGSASDLLDQTVVLVTSNRRIAVTLFVDGWPDSAATPGWDAVDSFKRFLYALKPHVRSRSIRLTVVLNLAQSMTLQGPDGLGLASQLDFRRLMTETGIRIVLVGSFYKALGLPGAFMAGDKFLVEELRWSVPTYFFSTSMPALLCIMVQRALETNGLQVHSGRGERQKESKL